MAIQTQAANIQSNDLKAVIVTPLARHEHGWADWHDSPLRYAVRGPALEVQKFSTKKDALKYAAARRRRA